MAQYLKPDSELGYVEDIAEIESLKFNNLRHVVLGCMLGDFDEVGTYVVDPEVVQELIEMEKYVVDTYDNIELCKSALKLDKQISFMVTYEGNRATLSLVEKLNYEANYALNSGTYSNINEFVLDEVETSGEINRNAIYARWNIKTVPSAIVDIFNCDDSVLEKYFGIVNRFKYLLQSNKTLLEKEEELEEIEAGYANDLLKILSHYPELYKAVMNSIKESLSERKNSVNIKKPFFVKTMNEIIENAIQKNVSVLNEKEKEEFESEKRNAVVKLNINRQDVLDVEKVDHDNKEISPKVPKLKVVNYDEKSVQQTGEEFAKANKEVEQKLNGNKQTETNSELIGRIIKNKAIGEEVEDSKGKKDEESEKTKLIATLVGAGVGALIGGSAGAVVGAATGAVVAEAVDKAKKAADVVAPAKKAPAKIVAKKPVVKKAVKSKAEKTKVEKPQKTKKDTPEKSTESEQPRRKKRRYDNYTDGYFSKKEPQKEKDTEEKDMFTLLSRKRIDEIVGGRTGAKITATTGMVTATMGGKVTTKRSTVKVEEIKTDEDIISAD